MILRADATCERNLNPFFAIFNRYLRSSTRAYILSSFTCTISSMHGLSTKISDFAQGIAYIKTRTAFSALGPCGPLAESSARFYSIQSGFELSSPRGFQVSGLCSLSY